MVARVLAAVLVFLSVEAFAETNTVEIRPTGAYADINVAHDNELVSALAGGDASKVRKAAEEVFANLDAVNPVVLIVLSNVYFPSDKDGASMIFYIGQLRARIDANLCADESAREAVSVLTAKFGPRINQYVLQNKERATKIVEKSIAYVRGRPVTYDRRWINLHGLNAMSFDGSVNPAPLSIPQDDWDATIKKTIDDYDGGFHQLIATFDFSTVPPPSED